jgi:adenylyltransferase/sulfurtransferase
VLPTLHCSNESTSGPTLGAEELERYQRQILLWGAEGQRRLKAARLLVLGAGGLGSPVLQYLAAAGVGELVIADPDAVSRSNLNRQILHDERRLGLNKAASARTTIGALNRNVEVTAIERALEHDELLEVAALCDLVIDVTDNMPHKESLSPLLVRHGLSGLFGVLLGMGGFCFTYTPGSACWHCLFKPAPAFPTGRALPMENYPSFGAAAGFVGSFIANIAVRQLLGFGRPVENKLFFASQLMDLRKLELCSRGLKALMTDHLKESFHAAGARFPESERFFDEHLTQRRPGCAVCSSRSGSDPEPAPPSPRNGSESK